MKASYDLHIHSALSPCAEPEMTPNNIVNMSVIKELDFIAITDHNAIENVQAALEVAEELPIIVVPGIEVQTKEDVHILCLFKEFSSLKSFYEELICNIQKIPHDTKKFGDQNILNADDQVIGTLTHSLYASIQLSVDEIIERAIGCGGGVIPCHLDRASYSMIANLGFIAPDLPIRSVEFSPACDPIEFTKRHLYLRKYEMLINSDAHELVNISEPVHHIDVEEKTIEALFKALFGGK
ncbi:MULTISPECIES: PHP domain-containing protein [unclassified Fusibacter]|uniref:PHP domain-containing protein n=1 Tax=unclassified Fusibacter TaxID=2624464 RepID=UPI001012AE11|nr:MULTISPECIES: PHP domain-containing protein [unclassified Fusibacter]MCK8060586.1 PHP domain-containing protein [Fusibacter sp. A2]NPE22960.1 PHP domain-containing protein [Fusibacter sp. A1]RXV60025.1 PHP domain-containing protein [Fusibacter sp. A1]